MKGVPKNRGLTIIELLLVVIVICILATLIALTFSGVKSKNHNAERRKDIDALKSQLETYYAVTNVYPTQSNINDPAWRAQNLKRLSSGTIQDPSWDDSLEACTDNGKPTLANKPTANCYSYQVVSTDGSDCDNAPANCAHYTITTVLEGGESYVKTSLN